MERIATSAQSKPVNFCQGCKAETQSVMCCPKCSELGKYSVFCSQDCFAKSWNLHDQLQHTQAPQPVPQPSGQVNPQATSRFTGQVKSQATDMLKRAEVVSQKALEAIKAEIVARPEIRKRKMSDAELSVFDYEAPQQDFLKQSLNFFLRKKLILRRLGILCFLFAGVLVTAKVFKILFTPTLSAGSADISSGRTSISASNPITGNYDEAISRLREEFEALRSDFFIRVKAADDRTLVLAERVEMLQSTLKSGTTTDSTISSSISSSLASSSDAHMDPDGIGLISKETLSNTS